MRAKPIDGFVDVNVQIGGDGFDGEDYGRGWYAGFFGGALPEDATESFRLAHARGVERAVEDDEWRAGDRVRQARAEGARLLILELLCDDGTVEGSRAQADAIADRLLEPGFYEATVETNERLGMK